MSFPALGGLRAAIGSILLIRCRPRAGTFIRRVANTALRRREGRRQVARDHRDLRVGADHLPQHRARHAGVAQGLSVWRRGVHEPLEKSEFEFLSCVPIGVQSLLEPTMHVSCALIPTIRDKWVTGFDAVAGRDIWYAGTAIIDGTPTGPPFGMGPMAATCDGAVLLAWPKNPSVAGTLEGSRWKLLAGFHLPESRALAT